MALERIMAEGIQGPGPEAVSVMPESASVGPPEAEQASKRPPGVIYSPGFDPQKVGTYEPREVGHYNVFFDPATGKEVARLPSNRGAEGPEDRLQKLVSDWLQDFALPEGEERLRLMQRYDSDFATIKDAMEKANPGQFERLINKFTSPQNDESAQAAEGVAGGGENERGAPPEGPRGPRSPEMGDKEWETSPERGRAIAREIIRLEADPINPISYAERYRVTRGLMSEDRRLGKSEIYKENGIYLDQLYEDLKDYTKAWRRIRNIRDETDPWDPEEVYKKIVEAIQKRAERRDRGEPEEETNQLGISQRDRGKYPDSLPTQPLSTLFDKYKSETNAEAVEGDMAILFQAARSLGLLDRAEAFFTSFYQQLRQGNIREEEVEDQLKRVRDNAKGAIEGMMRNRKKDPQAKPLVGIAEAFSTRIYDIFGYWLSGEKYTPVEGEFSLSQDQEEVEDTEKYWRPGPYPKMYDFIAKTKKHFSRAKDSFLSMITGGALGDSPDELYEHFNNFTEKFRQASGALGIDSDYIKSSALEILGRGFVFGGDYSFETYNMKSANQFLMAMALNKGPQRWVAVARSANGEVGAYLRKFDYDPRVKLMHNPGGSRGQLLNDTVTQHFLHAEIRNILIEEGMGVAMKDYDPRDQASAAYDPGSIRVLNLPEAEDAREKALAANVARIGIHQPKEEFIGLYDGFDTGGAHIVNYKKYENLDEEKLKQLSPRLRKSVIIGKVQTKLQTIPRDRKEDNKDQLLGAIDKLRDGGQLTDKDKKIWEEAYDHAKASFATAFQMVGATGEKARRGGGVFFIDRNAHIEAYQRFKDISDTRLTEEQINLKRSGRIQIELKGGKEWKKLSEEDREFYQALKDHGRFVDNMPVYLGEMFVQYAETRTKIEYSDESGIWDKKTITDSKGKIYTLNQFFATGGKMVGEMTDKDGKEEVIETKAAYRTYMVWKARKEANDQIKTNGFEGKLRFPKLLFDSDDENSPTFGNIIGVDGDQTQTIDFETATDPENPLNKWMNDTYFSYQPENRHQITNPDVLKAAKKRRMRLLRPDPMTEPESAYEQHENLADLRLIMDPTLNRVLSLQDTDMPEGFSAQQAEILFSAAAIEASNMSHWRITRELNAQFLSPVGNMLKERTGYNLEDYSGIARFIIRMRQFVASDPNRFARRYAAEIANLPLNVSSMPDQWGQVGVLGAIEMFADPIGDMSEQKQASQFAITKWVEQMRIGNLIYDALVGHVDSEHGFSVEGLFEKPTNNAEKIAAIQANLTDLEVGTNNYDAELKFMNLVLESFDRLWTLLKMVRTNESDTRNAQGALDLEKQDILKDGKIDAGILEKLAKDKNTGSSRHTEEKFFYAYIDWLIKGAGAEAYKGENAWYKLLLGKSPLDPKGGTRADWLFNKMAR